MEPYQLPDYFPNTYNNPFFITSPETSDYNCIAWACEKDNINYWPESEGDEDRVWPEGISRNVELESFVELFKSIGYEKCEDESLEKDYLKVAIYANSLGIPKHAARQRPDGLWTSKLGRGHDVIHSLYSMSNGFYGNVVVFMKRKLDI